MTKGNFPNISDDLVNSYHLLLCVVDWVYVNCVLGRRQDLLNTQFEGESYALVEDFLIIETQKEQTLD